MPSQTPPGDRTPPAPPTVPAAKSCSKGMKCVALVDWWLERLDGKICIAGLTETPQMRKENFSSQGSRKSAARVFKCSIAKVCGSVIVETANGHLVRINGFLNNTRMRENGFSEKVCESFMGGFPLQWKELVDLNMEQMNGHAQSPTKSIDNIPSAPVKYYLEKFMSDRFGNSIGYSLADISDLGEAGTPNCGKTSMKLGTGDEVPVAGTTPQSEAVQASEENKARALRSGRVLGKPISVPITGGNRRKRTQHKASENIPNEAASPTTELTSHENVCSVAATFAGDKLKSHDSRSKGRGRPAKRRKRSEALFTSFL